MFNSYLVLNLISVKFSNYVMYIPRQSKIRDRALTAHLRLAGKCDDQYGFHVEDKWIQLSQHYDVESTDFCHLFAQWLDLEYNFLAKRNHSQLPSLRNFKQLKKKRWYPRFLVERPWSCWDEFGMMFLKWLQNGFLFLDRHSSLISNKLDVQSDLKSK